MAKSNKQIIEDEVRELQKLISWCEYYTAIDNPIEANKAQKEIEEIAVIEKFLPAQLDEAAIAKIVAQIIETVGATGPQDLGKVMGVASKQLAGQADGKAVAAAVKAALT